MAQVTEAVFTQGVLKPVEELRLREQQRVRVIIEPLDASIPEERAAAMQRLREGIASMSFKLSGPLPSRSELHDRL